MLKATNFVKSQLQAAPRVAVVLGSGLGELADLVEGQMDIPYEEIPGFLRSTVPGHAGRLILGRLSGVEVILMSGRFHRYEGYSHRDIALPVRMMKELGVDCLLLTNAAGGVSPET